MKHDALPEIYCIIPHYGEDALLRCCLQAVRLSAYPQELFGPDRLLVVDNNPPHENLLFTRGVNAGLREARRRRRAHPAAPRALYWLLNNDAAPEPGCLAAALRCFQEQGFERTGLVGPRNLLLSDPDQIVWGGSLQCFPEGVHKSGRVSRGDLSARTEEEWISFSSVFINEAVLDEIGLLDEGMRHVASDADYCLRARAAGFLAYYEPSAVLYHAVGSSSRHAPPELLQRMRQDLRYFQDKWLGGALLRRLCPSTPLPGDVTTSPTR